MMKYVYILQHCYEKREKGEFLTDEVKILGIYSSEKKAMQAKKEYQHKKGFECYDEDSFYIDKRELDKNQWEDGFVTWDSSIMDWIE